MAEEQAGGKAVKLAAVQMAVRRAEYRPAESKQSSWKGDFVEAKFSTNKSEEKCSQMNRKREESSIGKRLEKRAVLLYNKQGENRKERRKRCVCKSQGKNQNMQRVRRSGIR